MRLAVSGTAASRPEYLREVIESWKRTDLERVDLFLWNVEPISPEVRDVARAFTSERTRVEVRENVSIEGALGNPWKALERAFDAGADFVIVAEDDSIVSLDVVGYFNWAATEYEHDDDIFVVCAFQNGREDSHCEDGNHVTRRPGWFYATIWGVWRKQWEEELRDNWDFDYSRRGWDWDLKRIMGDRCALVPCRSRSQHIGKQGGTHCSPKAFPQSVSSNFVTEIPYWSESDHFYETLADT